VIRKRLEKTPTYIQGFDEILEGGLPVGRISLVTGGPGSGKSVFGLEFLYRGALAGEPGILVGFEEPPDMVRVNGSTLGFDIAGCEAAGKLFLLKGHLDPKAILGGSFSLAGMLAILDGKVREMGARRIVFDALEVVLRLIDSSAAVRAELHALHDWIVASGLTTVMTLKPRIAGPTPFEDFFDSMASCVLAMDTRVADQIATRRLRVIKYRGSAFGRNEYPYVITATGLRAVPISSVALNHQPLGERVTTGIAKLDDMLAGGYARAACILVSGLPGTGKTILATTFTEAACCRGERVLYISFEESAAALVGNVKSAGIGLEQALATDCLRIIATMPEATGAEEHLLAAIDAIDDFQPAHVVVDAISACSRMGGYQASYEYLMRLLNYCKERGITILLINQSTGTTSHFEISGAGISSMVDTVLFLTYLRRSMVTNRGVEVLKTRGSGHCNRRRRFVITDAGIQILDEDEAGADDLPDS